MRILLLTTHFNTGGITSYLLSLALALSQRGHFVIVASAGGNCEGILNSYGVKHFNLGFRTKSEADPRIYINLGELKDLVEREKIDVIHAQTRVTQVMGYFLSRMTQKPMITTCHGFFKPKFFRRIFPCWGSAVIAISRAVKEHLIRDFKVPSEKVYEISNGVDCQQFKPSDDFLRAQARTQWNIKAPLVVGIIARLSDVKGIDILLNAWVSVLKKYPKSLLMIVGEGPEHKSLENLVENLGLKANVRFEKIVNKTAQLLPAFDIFVMPSRQEGLGLSVMEAQACALPVIASRVGGLVDLIEDGKTGYFVRSTDVEDLAQKINFVLGDLAKAKGVGLAAREHILENFSLEQMVASTVKVYEQYSCR